MKFKIQIKDGINAFGAYIHPTARQGEARIFIDGQMIFKDGQLEDEDGNKIILSTQEKKQQLITTILHEFGHALEDFFQAEFDHDFIEQIEAKYMQDYEKRNLKET